MKQSSIVLLLLLAMACNTTPKEQASLQILRYALTDYIPSASGIEFDNGELVITGDDAPNLYFLDQQQWKIQSEHPIAKVDSMIGNRMYYKTKPDFEAISLLSVNGFKHFLVVGSGSKETLRDTCVVFNAGNKTLSKKFSLRPLFNAFVDSLGSSVTKINIEGLATGNGKVYFAHRGSVQPPNAIFEMNVDAFLAFTNSENPSIPAFKVHKIQVPTVKGELAGLSGLDIVDGKGLLLCASVEATTDPTRDGEILGSFVAALPFSDLKKGSPNFTPVLKDGKPLITKIESVAVKHLNKNELFFFAVSDNDNGSSEIFEMKLTNLPWN